MPTLEGTIIEVRNVSEDGAWGVFMLHDGKRKALVKGSFEEIAEDVYVSVQGDWQNGRYGRIFAAASIAKAVPKGEEATVRFLKELPHIGKATAEKAWRKWKDNAVDQIIAAPSALTAFIPLSELQLEDIKKNLEARKDRLDIERALIEIGIGPQTRKKALDLFPSLQELRETLKSNPYRLIVIPGVGFPSLDAKILSSGRLESTSPERISAAVLYAVTNACDSNGHTVVTLDLVRNSMQGIGVEASEDEVLSHLAEGVEDGALIEENGSYSPVDLYRAERKIADHFRRLLNGLPGGKAEAPEDKGLNPLQQTALQNALSNGLSILTGGPGTGKTYSLNAILRALGKAPVFLCAPTGKAAKRMTEVTGRRATTMHSLVNRIRLQGFKLPKDATVILDECSMIGVELLADFLDAVNSSSAPLKRLLLVGDDDQLPSISPGSVLQDGIASKTIPTVKLTQLMRQLPNSHIARNAAAIRAGASLTFPPPGSSEDFYFSAPTSPSFVIDVLKNRMGNLQRPGGDKYSLLSDVQVLSPVYKGEWGCDNFNNLLQKLLNPAGPGKAEIKTSSGSSLRVGDKILISKNNPKLGIANGDVGLLKSISTKGQAHTLLVEIESQTISIPPEFFDHVQLAYCITIHKAQGSEAPMIVALFPRSVPPMMRQRNLLYTALTRAREKLWLVADKGTIRECIDNVSPNERCTRLAGFLSP